MKYTLLTAAFGILICASASRGDFFISSTGTPNAFSIGGQSFDTYLFFVTNTGTNGTGTSTDLIDLGIYDSTNGGKNGMLISASNSTDGSDAIAQTLSGAPNPVEGYPDLFGQLGEASLPHTSWLKNINGYATPALDGTSVVTFNSGFHQDEAYEGPSFKNTYSDLQLVGGFGAIEFWSYYYPDVSGGVEFARATVLHGDVITLVVPTEPINYGRTGPSASWETGGTSFGIVGAVVTAPAVPNATGTYTTSPAPEPSSATALTLAAIALLARRRCDAN